MGGLFGAMTVYGDVVTAIEILFLEDLVTEA